MGLHLHIIKTLNIRVWRNLTLDMKFLRLNQQEKIQQNKYDVFHSK